MIDTLIQTPRNGIKRFRKASRFRAALEPKVDDVQELSMGGKLSSLQAKGIKKKQMTRKRAVTSSLEKELLEKVLTWDSDFHDP